MMETKTEMKENMKTNFAAESDTIELAAPDPRIEYIPHLENKRMEAYPGFLCRIEVKETEKFKAEEAKMWGSGDPFGYPQIDPPFITYKGKDIYKVGVKVLIHYYKDGQEVIPYTREGRVYLPYPADGTDLGTLYSLFRYDPELPEILDNHLMDGTDPIACDFYKDVVAPAGDRYYPYDPDLKNYTFETEIIGYFFCLLHSKTSILNVSREEFRQFVQEHLQDLKFGPGRHPGTSYNDYTYRSGINFLIKKDTFDNA